MHPAVDGAPPPARVLIACVCVLVGIVNSKRRRKRRFGTWLDRRTLLCRAVLTYDSEINLHFAIASLVHVDDTGIPRLNFHEVPKITDIYLHRIRRQADRRSFRRGLSRRGNVTPPRRRACIRRGGRRINAKEIRERRQKWKIIHAGTPPNETQRNHKAGKGGWSNIPV